MVLKRLVYEKDRLDPVDPSAKLSLDQDLLKSFPEGYRHLAYLQTKIGYKVKKDMAGPRRPRSRRALCARRALARRWGALTSKCYARTC